MYLIIGGDITSELDNILEKCIGSEMPFCQAACPLHVDMKGAISLIREDKFDEALKLIQEQLPFAGILGRVCSHPCEDVCRRKDVDEPVAIMCLKRIAADYAQESDLKFTIACLLYTSPSPRDRQRSRMPSSA